MATTATKIEVSSAAARRAPLIAAMHRLEGGGVSCAACAGTCCTFVANSMQITPLEALDLVRWLDAEGRLTGELAAALEANVAAFALDRPLPGDGRRVFGRRRYTCPFFKGSALGCTVAPEAKPYGCLGFNARREGVTDGEACASDQEALAERERAQTSEASENAALARRLGLSWDKKPIPVAVLEVWRALM